MIDNHLFIMLTNWIDSHCPLYCYWYKLHSTWTNSKNQSHSKCELLFELNDLLNFWRNIRHLEYGPRLWYFGFEQNMNWIFTKLRDEYANVFYFISSIIISCSKEKQITHRFYLFNKFFHIKFVSIDSLHIS